jgi:hypothetical protein
VLTPHVWRPWPVLGLCACFPVRQQLDLAEEEWKLGLGIIDEGSNHDGEESESSLRMSSADVQQCMALLEWAKDDKCNVFPCLVFYFYFQCPGSKTIYLFLDTFGRH